MTGITAVSDASFASEVLASELPVLVDFWAPWCGPCVQVSPILEEIAAAHGTRLRIVKLNVDENPVTAARYRITGMPTLTVFRDGDVALEIRGAKPRAALLRDLAPVLDAH